MAREVALMERGFDRMNVPADKVQKYLDDGWTETSRTVVADDANAKAPKVETQSNPEAESKAAEKKAKAEAKKAAKKAKSEAPAGE